MEVIEMEYASTCEHPMLLGFIIATWDTYYWREDAQVKRCRFVREREDVHSDV
jgi:hypothetical protein